MLKRKGSKLISLFLIACLLALSPVMSGDASARQRRNPEAGKKKPPSASGSERPSALGRAD